MFAAVAWDIHRITASSRASRRVDLYFFNAGPPFKCMYWSLPAKYPRKGKQNHQTFREMPGKRKKAAMYIQIQTYTAAFAHNMYRKVSLKGSNPFPYGNKRFGIFFGFTLRKSIWYSNYLTFCRQTSRISRNYNEIAQIFGAICSGHLFCPDIMVRQK